MATLTTYPSKEVLQTRAADTPKHMRPNEVPFAAVLEGFLSVEQCIEIQNLAKSVEAYTHPDCGALTREIPFDPSLDPIEEAGRFLNRMYWKYDLDPGQFSWLQTYEAGMGYQMHMDGSPGQMRKLTAVALLTEEDQYAGGTLRLHYHPLSFDIPRSRGTISMFPSWILHDVSPVTKGVRQTINMGFWGPPFK